MASQRTKKYDLFPNPAGAGIKLCTSGVDQ